ncbi:hypothetical protein BB559_006734 [Furculomyces boomerangus]|uniref:Anoctamin transmembrane domain-containing protein n=1 Tax=Furculomyces boomerangus TaxID=61424 RepID=A0A2T9Y0Y5_9FUNG|nr:hypothetical protein BB559_006734 [Furculomyces boomerangus]
MEPQIDTPAADYSKDLRFMNIINKHWEIQKTKRNEKYISSEFIQDKELLDSKHYADFVIIFQYKPPSTKGVLNNLKHPTQSSTDKANTKEKRLKEIQDSFKDTIESLTNAGLFVEVRKGISRFKLKPTSSPKNSPPETSPKNNQKLEISLNENLLILFITCSKERLEKEHRRQLLVDYQIESEKLSLSTFYKPGSGSTPLLPDIEKIKNSTIDTQLPESERQRLVLQIITGPVEDGGANIHTHNEKCVTAIFPIHDKDYNKEWIKRWSTKWLIDQNDLQDLKEHFGEEISMYFAFLQYYFLWLIIPSVFGVIAFMFDSSFSIILSFLTMIWSVLFTETWSRRQKDLATFWNVQDTSRKREEPRRSKFIPESYKVDDLTGETIPVFPEWKRWLRRALGIPVILACLVGMFLLVAATFALQLFTNEMYNGPFSKVVSFLPTILYSAFMPAFTNFCQHIALRLTEYENYEYKSEFKNQYSTKIFLFQFLRDQGNLLLMAWVFIPFRDNFEKLCDGLWLGLLSLVYKRDTLSVSTIWKLKGNSIPAAENLQNLLIYFIVTAQIINQVTESFLPALMNRFKHSDIKKSENSLSTNGTGKNDTNIVANAENLFLDGNEIKDNNDLSPEILQAKFVYNISEEANLPSYDLYEDYAEMATQFGYVSFYTIVWPLAPLISFINNFIELRSDAAKICLNVRRPTPARANSIGLWLPALNLTAWLGSIANALLIYQFNPSAWFFPQTDAKQLVKYGRTNWTWALIVAVFSEHLFLACVAVVNAILKSWPSASEKALAAARKDMKISMASHILTENKSSESSSNTSSRIPQESLSRELEYGLQSINDSFKLN